MKEAVFYVAVTYQNVFQPAIVEKFDELSDASSYAALMSRTKKRNYVVLQVISEWDGEPQG